MMPPGGNRVSGNFQLALLIGAITLIVYLLGGCPERQLPRNINRPIPQSVHSNAATSEKEDSITLPLPSKEFHQ